jgi:pseudaminic acid biosynthesis-associated methylase
VFNQDLIRKAWRQMLSKTTPEELSSILECGCNIGRNLLVLKELYPAAQFGCIEINRGSFEIAVRTVEPTFSYCGSIVGSDFTDGMFDLVFTSGVLIHIAPYDLYRNMKKLFDYSRQYVLISEYFARTLETKIYHGAVNKLFKMDFGKFFLENFDVAVVDYGFLWGVEFDQGGFDDTTWWLFRKNQVPENREDKDVGLL